jgi:hypothetical protein
MNTIFRSNIIGSLKGVLRMLEGRESSSEITTDVQKVITKLETGNYSDEPVVETNEPDTWSSERHARTSAQNPFVGRAYMKWNDSEDDSLTREFKKGDSRKMMMNYHGRSSGSIVARLQLLGLVDSFGNKIQ